MVKKIAAFLSKYWTFVILALMASVVVSKVLVLLIIGMLGLFLACVFYEVLTF